MFEYLCLSIRAIIKDGNSGSSVNKGKKKAVSVNAYGFTSTINQLKE